MFIKQAIHVFILIVGKFVENKLCFFVHVRDHKNSHTILIKLQQYASQQKRYDINYLVGEHIICISYLAKNWDEYMMCYFQSGVINPNICL